MPHLTQFEQEAGHNAIVERFGSQEEFENWLKNVITEAFNLFAYEDLDKETQIATYPVVTTHNMPIDICIQVVCWHSPDRKSNVWRIERLIRQRLNEQLDQPLSVETNAYLSVVMPITDTDAVGRRHSLT